MRSVSQLTCAVVFNVIMVGCGCRTAEAQPVAQDKAHAAAKSGITFQIIDGAENGSLDILDKRKAEIMEKKGEKLSGHDWWLWGLTGIDYDRDGDTDLIVTIHGPAGHGV